MYADQISTGRKRSIHDRIDGDQPAARAGAGAGGRGARNPPSKRSARSSSSLLLLFPPYRPLLRGICSLHLSTSLCSFVAGALCVA